MLDLVKAVYRGFKDKKVLPRFFIYEPDEVPESVDAVGITTKVKQMIRKLDSVTEHLKQAPMWWPTAVTTKQHSTPLPYLVVVKNPLKSLESPDAHKDFILTTYGKLSDDIVELKKNKDEWKVIVKSKDSAEKSANAMKVGNSPLETSVKSKRFLGVLRFVPNDLKAKMWLS